ncbi:chaperone protein dnaJ 20 [Cucumis melo var. makuwa]|uniref:Chaperone protein dnaJ 20 n=1 Tax=Cucumis melo var. makuwa TaxID=1194695 RepID=A0A5D3D388_CUCMM|nr:chaperone protein dnaJ 20 [Cucumis melo var. makuwa]TYK17426.1 chaperone protein dnaJ 20 [Cucumis melo var. makuwa]
MQCSDFTFSGSDSRFYIPSNPTISARRPISGYRSRVFFPHTPPFNSTRLPSLSIRAKASFNEGFVSSEVAEGSFYDLLGISQSGSLAEIKRAYKQLARKYHPDVSPPGGAEEYTKMFIRVQEAYETLSDPRRRALYDRDMIGGLQVAFSARRRYDAAESEERKRRFIPTPNSSFRLSFLVLPTILYGRRSCGEKWMEKQLGSSDFGIEEKKYGEGFETKYVMGSSNAPANE